MERTKSGKGKLFKEQFQTKLHEAIIAKDEKSLKKILKEKKKTTSMLNVKHEDLTPMLWAIKLDEIPFIKLLLQFYKENKRDINEVDQNGFSLLHNAILIPASDQALKAILEFEGLDINVNIENNDKNTPLHYFCEKFNSPQCQEPLELMIEKGAKLDVQNAQGETPLHKAIFNRSVRLLIVDFLLDRGADVNIRTNMGESALSYAIRLKRVDLIDLLLKKGANPTIKGRKGETLMDIAKVNRAPEQIIKKIKKAYDLCEWLKGLELAEYDGLFLREELFLDVLPDVDDNQLEKVGIKQLGHRVKILNAAKDLAGVIDDREPTSAGLISIPLDLGSLPSVDVDDEDIEEFFRELPNMNISSQMIGQEDLEFTKIIDSGSSGNVFEGLYKDTVVAIKVLKDIPQQETLEDFAKEIAVLSALNSKEIVKLHGLAKTAYGVCLVMEYCSRKSLYSVMLDKKLDFGWDKVLRFSFQMTRGMDYLHNFEPKPIVHRDMKSLNLLVTNDWHVKVCDFGLSRFVDDNNMETFHKVRGTAHYTAPELVLGTKSFSEKSDIYSMGIVIWELVNRCVKGFYQKPFYEEHVNFPQSFMYRVAKEKKRPTMPENTPQQFLDLIELCWNDDWEKRPTTKDIMKKLFEIENEYKSNKDHWDSLRNMSNVKS